MIDCPYCSETNIESNQYCKSCGRLINLEIRKEFQSIAGFEKYIFIILFTYSLFIVELLFFDNKSNEGYFIRFVLTLINGALGSLILAHFLIKNGSLSFTKFYPQFNELIIFFGISQGIFNLLVTIINVADYSSELFHETIFSCIIVIVYLISFYFVVWYVTSKILIKKIEMRIKIKEI